MKLILSILFCLLLSSKSQAQLDSNCITPVGVAQEGFCTQTPVDTILNGQTSTNCFTFKPSGDGNIHFGFLLTNNTCGPNAAYNFIHIDIYNTTCDTLIDSTTLNSPNWDFFTHLDTAENYIICYTIKAKCSIFSMCPVINASTLPLHLIYLRAVYSKEDRRILITWTTAGEENTDYYIVQEYVYDTWININKTIPSHDYNNIHTYTVVDDIISYVNAYRIKEVGYNGDNTYSKAVLVQVNPEECQCTYFDMYGNIVDISYAPTGTYIKKCKEDFEKIIHLN